MCQLNYRENCRESIMYAVLVFDRATHNVRIRTQMIRKAAVISYGRRKNLDCLSGKEGQSHLYVIVNEGRPSRFHVVAGIFGIPSFCSELAW